MAPEDMIYFQQDNRFRIPKRYLLSAAHLSSIYYVGSPPSPLFVSTNRLCPTLFFLQSQEGGVCEGNLLIFQKKAIFRKEKLNFPEAG